jgi:signal transduction histidine kinase
MFTQHAFESAEASLYQAEVDIAQRAQALVEDPSNKNNDVWQLEFSKLAKNYGVLLNETMKITRISDSVQEDMRRLQQDLKRALEQSEYLRSEAEEANRRKTELLSIVAHDLKNPVGAMMGLAEIVTTLIPKGNPAFRYADQIMKTSERTILLIKDLLDSAALDLGKIIPEFEETRLSLLVTNIVEANQIQAMKKEQEIRLEIQSGVSIKADSERLRQALDNLISNAVKYSPKGKVITVRLRATESSAHMEIQDQGPGFTEEDKQKLFGFFQRLSAVPTGGESSNGVGLAITKKIIDLHRGTILCDSELGTGTTFIIELPRKQQ